MHAARIRLAVSCAAAAVTVSVAAAGASGAGTAGAHSAFHSAPIVTTEGGAVRGAAVSGGFAFRGVPYAAPPTGDLRWRAPQRPASWEGVRDATTFAPSCPQRPSVSAGPGPFSEDCLYVTVSTPTLRHSAHLPVLVWFHGGGFTQDASRNYDGSKLAAHGLVVVTVGYRLGALVGSPGTELEFAL